MVRISGKPVPGRFRARLARFRRDRRGSAALEFAMLAPPFFLMIFAVIETTILFFVNATLENGVQETARLVRTGQAQAASMTAEQFRGELCAEIAPLLACDARLVLDVRTFQNFNAADFADPVDADGNLALEPVFAPGAPGDVVLVRAIYQWNVMTPFMGPLIQNMSGGRHLIASTAAFRNEPFGELLN